MTFAPRVFHRGTSHWPCLLALGLLLAAVASPRAGADECTPVFSLPYQNVNGTRLIHLGEGAGRAGRRVELCHEPEIVVGYRFNVREDNVVLDCGGTRFSGASRRGHERVCLELDRAKQIRNLRVRGCGFHGFETGVLLTGAGIEGELGSGPHRIRLTDVEVADSHGVGVYVGPHSRDVDLKHLTVRRSRTVGVYVDAESRRIRLTRSRIEDNGASRCRPGREGVAIDAASGVVIRENIFERNRYAGVAVYRNCGESGAARPWVTSNVRIEHNIFRDHSSVSGGAVVVGSRQGLRLAQTQCFSGDCVDVPLDDDRFADHVRDVVVRGNLFEGGPVGVRVQVRDTSVVENLFNGSRLIVGLPWLVTHPELGGAVRVRRNVDVAIVDGGGLKLDTD